MSFMRSRGNEGGSGSTDLHHHAAKLEATLQAFQCRIRLGLAGKGAGAHAPYLAALDVQWFDQTGNTHALYLATQHPEAAAVLAFAPAIRLRLTPVRQFQLRLLAPLVMGVPKGGLDASDNWQGYRVNPLRGVLQLLAMQRALVARLHLIRQPLFVGQGRFDTTIHPQAGEMVLNGVSSTLREMHWYERSSHVVLLDGEIDTVIADVENFLRRAL